jgi:hypothetical protein
MTIIMFSKTNHTALIKQIDQKIKWILENEDKFYFWVPLATFVVGAAIAIIHN